jgi:23S rRNA m2A2503 methyltransferase
VKTDLKNFSYDELKSFIGNIGESAYRADQIFSWLTKGVTSIDEMSNLSKDLKRKLSEVAYISSVQIEEKFVSKIDGTVKYLMKLNDDEYIECVVMFYKHGISMCISSQIGCNMGCKFCASTIGGKTRDLTAAEMLGQIMTAQNDLGKRISHIVIMGMGEPLDNYDAVVKFLRNVNNDKGLNIGFRHITVSTCGLVPNMLKLAQENMQITLSVSLHAPNNAIRSKIMPINTKYPIEEVISAIDQYIKVSTRRVSIEYAMIAGVNDSPECARELASHFIGKLIHVNLIPVNPICEDGFQRSQDDILRNFEEELKKSKINVTIRRKMGSDINASCGQLRKSRRDSEILGRR